MQTQNMKQTTCSPEIFCDNPTDELILVDVYDRQIGTATKKQAHKYARLHRAFSIFIYNGDKMLLQRRAAGKYHSGGLITNACCSHPRNGESLELATMRRLREELGFECDVKELFSFIYYHKFHETMFEYEFDHVFLGEYDGAIYPNCHEVSETFWMSFDELADDLRLNPQNYTVWFLTAAPKVLEILKSK